jgi:hypothetical protein
MLTIVALKGLLPEKVPHNLHNDIVRVSWWMLVLNEMMNQTESTTSDLELKHDRIVEFLALYKKVFGPTAAAYSITGLRKVKFHAPKHALFYIKRYGSSDNFFGGKLESALKSTVKAPTKQTSRRHVNLSKELACRQQDQFVCTESRMHNAESMDEFGSDVRREGKLKRWCSQIESDTTSAAKSLQVGNCTKQHFT